MVDISRFDVIHDTLYQHALADIQSTGTYCHQIVLTTAGYSPSSVHVNWGSIRDAIFDTVGAEMIPLALLYFMPKEAKRHGYAIATHPEKFIAIGHGKQTWGYGLVSSLPDALVEFWTKQTGAQAKGHLQKHKEVYDTALNGGKLLGNVRSPEQIAGDYIPVSDDDDDGDVFG